MNLENKIVSAELPNFFIIIWNTILKHPLLIFTFITFYISLAGYGIEFIVLSHFGVSLPEVSDLDDFLLAGLKYPGFSIHMLIVIVGGLIFSFWVVGFAIKTIVKKKILNLTPEVVNSLLNKSDTENKNGLKAIHLAWITGMSVPMVLYLIISILSGIEIAHINIERIYKAESLSIVKTRNKATYPASDKDKLVLISITSNYHIYRLFKESGAEETIVLPTVSIEMVRQFKAAKLEISEEGTKVPDTPTPQE